MLTLVLNLGVGRVERTPGERRRRKQARRQEARRRELERERGP